MAAKKKATKAKRLVPADWMPAHLTPLEDAAIELVGALDADPYGKDFATARAALKKAAGIPVGKVRAMVVRARREERLGCAVDVESYARHVLAILERQGLSAQEVERVQKALASAVQQIRERR